MIAKVICPSCDRRLAVLLFIPKLGSVDESFMQLAVQAIGEIARVVGPDERCSCGAEIRPCDSHATWYRRDRDREDA